MNVSLLPLFTGSTTQCEMAVWSTSVAALSDGGLVNGRAFRNEHFRIHRTVQPKVT